MKFLLWNLQCATARSVRGQMLDEIVEAEAPDKVSSQGSTKGSDITCSWPPRPITVHAESTSWNGVRR